jgi:hypothetical protein
MKSRFLKLRRIANIMQVGGSNQIGAITLIEYLTDFLRPLNNTLDMQPAIA